MSRTMQTSRSSSFHVVFVHPTFIRYLVDQISELYHCSIIASKVIGQLNDVCVANFLYVSLRTDVGLTPT